LEITLFEANKLFFSCLENVLLTRSEQKEFKGIHEKWIINPLDYILRMSMYACSIHLFYMFFTRQIIYINVRLSVCEARIFIFIFIYLWRKWDLKTFNSNEFKCLKTPVGNILRHFYEVSLAINTLYCL
jgi:hypothetical protein